LKLWKFPDQIIRVGIVLIVLIAGLIYAQIAFRPASFGEQGHYRAEAIPQIEALPISYAGWQACMECHDDVGETKNASNHRTLACEVCHGPARKHAEDPDSALPMIPRGRASCLHCHSYMPSRPTGFPQVIELMHNPMESCTECHDPHDPAPPEMSGDCSACHAQIARTKAISHHSSLECGTCHEAVADHSIAPRAHLPNKPTDRAFCGGCHAGNATSAKGIPRIDLAEHGGQYLCWQCHYPHFPEGG
jgi:hypothetical protein